MSRQIDYGLLQSRRNKCEFFCIKLGMKLNEKKRKKWKKKPEDNWSRK